MPVVYAAEAKPSAGCHAAAGAVARAAAIGWRAARARHSPDPPPAAASPAPPRASQSPPPPPAGTPAGPRFATEPFASPRAVKGGPAAVRPAFAIVARRMARLYDLMLLVDPAAPEERRNAA